MDLTTFRAKLEEALDLWQLTRESYNELIQDLDERFESGIRDINKGRFIESKED